MKYENIPVLVKIINIEKDKIFFTDAKNNIRVFELSDTFLKGLNKYSRKTVKNDFSSVKIIGDLFIWKEDDPFEVAIGKDTIWEFSHNITLDENLFLIKVLNQKRKISKKKILQSLNSLITAL